MKPVELNVARIGSSRGVRLPAPTLERYRIGAKVVMEERSDGILLRPPGSVSPSLSWEETAREMEVEGWGAWDVTLADGLDEIPWEAAKPPVVVKRGSKYGQRARGKR
jgi:antitoxin component of MazEF toxin-antitoxin module